MNSSQSLNIVYYGTNGPTVTDELIYGTTNPAQEEQTLSFRQYHPLENMEFIAQISV